MSKEVIGWALGPGRTEDAFGFVTPFAEQVKVGEFIYYNPPDHPETRILCRVAERERIIEKDSDILDTLGKEIPDKYHDIFRENKGYEVTANVLGYYNEQMGNFINLRQPPRMGQEVQYIQNDDLSAIIKPRKKQGILHLGHVLNREEEAVKVLTDMDELATKHLGVLASTGAGKSYTVGVILEEMVKPGNRGTSVVFDIHGEYYTLAEDERYSDKFNLIEDPRIKISNLTIEDFDVAFLEDATNVQMERLREVLQDLDIEDSQSDTLSKRYQDKIRTNYSIDDIIDGLSEGNRVDDALAWRLGNLKDFVSLSVDTETSIEELCEPGKCTIIEFPTGSSELERNLIFWYYTKRILNARKQYVRIERGKTSESAIPDQYLIEPPVTVIIEEAHNFAPNNRDIKTRNLLQEIAREGRKFGVGICIITQRPSRLDEDVLSQCNSTIIMKVKNAVDQETIARSVEAAGEDLLRDLPGLTTGQAILAGDFINTPVLTKVRERETEHGGRTPEVAKESVRAFKKFQEEQKEKRRKAARRSQEKTQN